MNTHHQSNKTSSYSPDAPTVPRDTLGFHGDSEVGPGLVDLAVNVRPDPLPDWLRTPIAAALDDLARYPDDGPARAALAARHGRDPAEVLTTAGAAQGFVLLARALRGVRRPVVVHPQFTEAEAALVAAGHRVERVLLPAPYRLDPDLVPDDADLVVIGNPTNPTSVLHPAGALARLARPGRVLVVDEAFADTVPGEPESLAGRADLPGLVVLRSLTKTWGLAGLRIGYLLAAPDLVELLAGAQPLWPVSTPALAAAVACADRRAVEAEQEIARDLAARRAHLVTGLQDIPGVRVAAPPSSSFVLIEVARGEAVRLALREAGFAVRRGDTFPGLGPDFLRIAVRETATTDAFLTALARVMARPARPGEVSPAGAGQSAADAGARSSVQSSGQGAGDPMAEKWEEPVADLLAQTLARVSGPDARAAAQAAELQGRLTKPPGSLGVLEDLSIRLAGLAGQCPPPLPGPAAVAVFAGDHGVYAAGVTPWPQEVTAQMVANFVHGGAVVNAFARECGASVTVVDVGVATPLPVDADGLVSANVRAGTRDFSVEPALTRDEVHDALRVGIRTAERQIADGAGMLVGGDMGIANTTPAAALIAAFTGTDPAEVTGRGTGVDDATLARKVQVISEALARYSPDPADPIGCLADVGGLEHAALAGYLLAGAAHRVPVIVDGVIACSAALAAVALHPDVKTALVAGHRSAEPGASIALAHLGLRPLLDLDLRLGEGTGALLAVPLVRAAARVLREVATFDSAGVAQK